MITIDFETKSFADLMKVGTWAYSEHPSTEIICVCWAIDDGPVQEWWPGRNDTDAMPNDLYMAVMTGHTVEAHNVAFEYALWHNVLKLRHGWVTPVLHQWRDTMAAACYYAMPAALDKLALALGFPGKNPEGVRLISKYSKLHLKTASATIPPEDFALFVNYCKDDVLLEQAVGDELGDLPEREQRYFKIWLETATRGLLLDADGIAAASAVVEQRNKELSDVFVKLTGLRPNQTVGLTKWLRENGIPDLPNMQAATLEKIMEEEELPAGPARRAIELRLGMNKASTKKLSAMTRQAGTDGRARFQTRYHGAVTGRETGAGFQPLNLNRGYDKMEPERLVGDIMHREAWWLDMLYGDAMEAVAKATRYWIMAGEGNRLMSADFSSIEAIVLACLAGEQWKINAFARGEPIYERTADKVHGLPAGTVSKDTHPEERQDGKVCELAFGYQGALGAWLGFDNSGRHSDERIIEFCKAWRGEHPETVLLWRGLEDAAYAAVAEPGKLHEFRGIGFEVVDEWLTMIGLNGKRLWYRDPEIRWRWPQWHQPLRKDECADGSCDCKKRPQVSYMAWKNKQWNRHYTYGGKLSENLVQFMSRELLMEAVDRVRSAGYTVVLTVYDEIVCEVPEDFGSEEEFISLITELPEWAAGWPVQASAWCGQRYRK